MSGLAIAAVAVLGAVFAWQMIDIIGPAWPGRLVRAIRSGPGWAGRLARAIGSCSQWVSRSAGAAMVALALIWLGAIAIVVGVVLPLGQTQFLFTFLRHNSLLAHGGWALIGLAVIAAATGYRGYRTGSRSWAPSVLGLIAAGIVVWMATGSSLRTGYEFVGLIGGPPSRPVLPLAVGPYVAGAGAILVSIGGWLLRQTSGASNRHSLLTGFRARKAGGPKTSGQQLGRSRPV